MTPRSVFVISPIGSKGTSEYRRYRLTLDYIVKKAFTAPEFAVVRADDESSPDSITTQVIGRIVESDLIVADLTNQNPNVFYELAVAHGYQKPVIHLMEEGQNPPFDLADQRVIFYDLSDPESVDKAISGLLGALDWLDDNEGRARNPLTAYGRFSAISTAAESEVGGTAIAEALRSLSSQIARLEARTPRAAATPDKSVSAKRKSIMTRVNALEMLRRTLLKAASEAEDASDLAEQLADTEIELDYWAVELAELDQRLG